MKADNTVIAPKPHENPEPGLSDRQKWWLVGLLIAGIGLRLAVYSANRGLWLDEESLRSNLVRGSLWNPWGKMSRVQIAPPLYVLMERWLSRLSGSRALVLRLPSLAASIAALGLFWKVVRRALPARTALTALALMAFSNEQLYFSTELKPYGLDLTIGLGLTLSALMARESGLSRRSLLVLAALGAGSVWFSFPSVFVLAGVGVWLFTPQAVARRWRPCLALIAVGAVWVSSFAVAYLAARSQVGDSQGLWEFWQVAFPPPLQADPLWVPRRLLFLFVYPLDFHGVSPMDGREWIDSRLVAAPAILASVLGVVWLARRRAGWITLLGLPVLFVLLASWLRLYPFHGRLVMFVVPSVLVTVASGVESVWSRLGRWAALPLVAVLLAPTVATDAYYLVLPFSRSGFHPLGDRRPPSMLPDYFETGPLLLMPDGVAPPSDDP